MRTPDDLMQNMNADMQMIDNAANFARQAVLASVTDDYEATGHTGALEVYVAQFDEAFAVGMALENRVREIIAAKAKEYEGEMQMIMADSSQQIITPPKDIILN